jgi:branched-subunit amino acid aminotransferase/4-amino-4-deoxychorismate lyase
MDLNGVPATLDQVKALALTNYGHFTSMLVENGEVRGLSLHMERLSRDCRQLFDHDLDTEQVRGYVRKVLGEQAGGRVVVRVTVFDPSLDLGTIGRDAHPHILVTHRQAASSSPAPWRLQAAAYQRDIPSVKHVGLLGPMQRRRAAQREGYDDVLFLNSDGTISEVATSNIGFVREGRIIWPRSAYLTGITMTLLNQELDEQIVTEPLTLSDLPGMEAAFATNAATGVRAVSAVDATEWPSDTHPALKELRELYADIPAEPV